MIEVAQEEVVSLSEACKRLPERGAGKKPHLATLYRWSTKGCRGVVLETIQIGGTRCTSVEALQRFFDRLAPPAAVEAGAGVKSNVEQQLNAAGLD